MTDMAEIVFLVDPIDSPFFSDYPPALRTVIRFSGNNLRVIRWADRIRARKLPEDFHAWVEDELRPSQ